MAKFRTAKQTKIKTKITGISQAVATFKSMGDEAAKVLDEAAKAGGDIALSAAKQNCPTRTGALKNSLYITKNKTKDPNVKAEYKVLPGKKEYYGTFVELGTTRQSAQPFMRPAVDNNKDKIEKAICDVIDKALGRYK